MKEYKVTDINPAGLTVDDYVRKPGAKFFGNEWKWGDEALEAAIKSGRCEMTYDDSEENVRKEKKSDVAEKVVKSEKTDKEKKIEQLEKMQQSYSGMDSKDEKAFQLLKSIEKLEAELKL